MRSTLRLALAVAASVLVAACGLVPEQQVTFKVPLTTDGSSDCSTVGAATVNLEENEDFNKYKDDIDSAKLTAIRVIVTNANLDGTSQATRVSGKAVATTESGESFDLGAYEIPIVDGYVQELQFDQAAADKVIKAALEAPHRFSVAGVGTGDAYPCKFGFRVEFDFVIQPSASAIF